MKRSLHLLLTGCFLFSGCASARLSQDQARKKIAEMAGSSLVPDSVQIQRIVSQNDTSAIAEGTVALAFQFRRASLNAEWRIEAVRLGDRDWIRLDELLAAVNEGRRRTSSQALQQVAEALDKYRAANGSLPSATDITSLSDTLYPGYMKVLVREDGWGNPILYERTSPSTFRLVSAGPDGLLRTPDDILVP
jgi:hypothetical protein